MVRRMCLRPLDLGSVYKEATGESQSSGLREEQETRSEKHSFQIHRMLEAHRFHAAEHQAEIAAFTRHQWPWPEDL
jgi:hypothetical protein